MKAIKHFQTITKHKILVMQECFRVGLYRQGAFHDFPPQNVSNENMF